MAKRSIAKRSMANRSTTAKSRGKSQPVASRPFAPGYGIVGAKEGKGLLPWTWVAGKMSACRTILADHNPRWRPTSSCDAGVGRVAGGRFSSSRPGENPARVKTLPPIPPARLRMTMAKKP